MILQISRDSLSSDSREAIFAIEKILSPFKADEQVNIAGESVLGILRGLRLVSENEPQRQDQFDSLCGQVQGWFRNEIETLRFKKSN